MDVVYALQGIGWAAVYLTIGAGCGWAARGIVDRYRAGRRRPHRGDQEPTS